MDMNMENKTFGELLKASMKSDDTEEWIDVYFTRPVGLAFALLWHRLGVSPNTITLLSIVLGVAAGAMFYFQNLCYNIIGVVLLVLANLCDSTDGQLARLTNQRSMKGRCLDGFAGDTWFFAIYLAQPRFGDLSVLLLQPLPASFATHNKVRLPITTVKFISISLRARLAQNSIAMSQNMPSWRV